MIRKGKHAGKTPSDQHQNCNYRGSNVHSIPFVLSPRQLWQGLLLRFASGIGIGGLIVTNWSTTAG